MVTRLVACIHRNAATVALANKLARIAWAVLRRVSRSEPQSWRWRSQGSLAVSSGGQSQEICRQRKNRWPDGQIGTLETGRYYHAESVFFLILLSLALAGDGDGGSGRVVRCRGSAAAAERPRRSIGSLLARI